MSNLWERLTHIYGHKFTSAYGESATDQRGDLTDVAQTWATGLSRVTGDQIARGLHALIESDEWITLPVLKRFCIGKQKNEFGLDYVPQYYRTERIMDKSRLLTSSEREKNRKKGEEALDKMKRELGIANRN